MRNNLIIQRALDIPAIRLELERQRKQFSQANKKHAISENNSMCYEDSALFIRILGTIFGVVLSLMSAIIETAKTAIGETAYINSRNELLTLSTYLCAVILVVIPSSIFVALHARLRFSLWWKEPSLLQFADFSSIIDAIEATHKTTVTIPDEFICLISRNIITHPACIIDCEKNQPLPGIYEKSQLLLWLNESEPKIPRLNIPFDVKKHRVEDDKVAAKEIQMFMEKQLEMQNVTIMPNY